MPFVRDFAEAADSGDVSTHTGVLPKYQQNDLLLWFVSKDTTTGAGLSTPSGWSVDTTLATNAAIRSVLFWKIAGASESAPATGDTGDADAYHSMMLAIGDVDTSTPFDATTVAASAALAANFTSTAITTATANALVLYLIGIDGNARNALSDHGVIFLGCGTHASTGTSIAWAIQRTAGASPTPYWHVPGSAVTNRFTVAIRNASNGRVPAYEDDAVDSGTMLCAMSSISNDNGYTFKTTPLSLSSIGSKTTMVFRGAITIGQAGCDIGESAVQLQGAAGSAVTTSEGFELNPFNPTLDLTAGPIAFSMSAVGPYVGRYQAATVSEVCTLMTFGDSSGNYRSYQVGAANSRPDMLGRLVGVVDGSQTTTAFATSGSLAETQVDRILFTATWPRGSGTSTIYLNELHQLGTLCVAGGDASTPVRYGDFDYLGRSFRLPVAKLEVAAITSSIPLQFGGGDAINMLLDGCVIQFPRLYDTTEKQISAHLATNVLGITYYAKSGDVIKHINSVVSSPSKFKWGFHASSATSGVTYDFSGLQVVNAGTVTLQSGIPITRAIFTNCDKIAAAGALLTDCTFNATTGAAALEVASVAQLDDVVRAAFNNNAVALRITAAGTYTLDGCLFSGNTIDIENASSGAVTVNLVNGANATTTSNTGGGSITLVNAVTVELTNVVIGSRYRVTRKTSGTLIGEGTAAARTVTLSAAYTADEQIVIVVRNASGTTKYRSFQTEAELTTAGASVFVSQELDPIA